MARWTRVYDGQRDEVSRLKVVKRTSGNPQRNGDWFIETDGCTATEASKLVKLPCRGVATQRQAKSLIEAAFPA